MLQIVNAAYENNNIFLNRKMGLSDWFGMETGSKRVVVEKEEEGKYPSCLGMTLLNGEKDEKEEMQRLCTYKMKGWGMKLFKGKSKVLVVTREGSTNRKYKNSRGNWRKHKASNTWELYWQRMKELR